MSVAEPLRGPRAARGSSRRWSRSLKRALDVVVAVVALVVLLPVLALVALAIRGETPGHPLLRQRRIGRDGRAFGMWKFRTMGADAEAARRLLVAQSKAPEWLDLDHDPRITRVGRVLRRSSLDELPQLWNVLRGEMSLVGPRPLIPEEDARVPAWARAREAVPPGMTGAWQVGGRTRVPFAEMLDLDRRYVTGWSLARDLAILARTPVAVLSRRGAK